ncbi:MAG: cation transporter, partial [Planctomycetales bacterium]|nr:cation transporter [Planctomycetales bacterium]
MLNVGFTLAEAVAGLVSGSMALVADAGHNLSDVLSLLLAWAASVLAARPPSERFTYGFRSSSILAAIAN